MNRRYVLSATVSLILTLFSFAPATFAHQNPPNCDSNSIVLTPTRDKLVVRNGDTINYTVSLSNVSSESQKACDLTNATVTLTLPAKDGTPTGKKVVLEEGVDYPAETKTKFLGTTPWVVDVNPGVEDAVIRAEVAGTLHDAPRDHDALIIKTLGTTVTQPHTTLRVTANPTSGQAPLTVTYTYTETNDSSTDAPISDIVVTDDKCEPVTYTGGDTDNDDILDVGETWTYTCTTTFTRAGSITNHVVATGTNMVDQKAHPIELAETTVDVTLPPAIRIEKGGPDEANVGDKVTYKMKVSIPDDVPLTNVRVSDPDCDDAPALKSKDDGDQDDVLELGEVWIYTCTRRIRDGDPSPLPNTATATGIGPGNQQVTAEDSHLVRIVPKPQIRITKAGPANAAVGEKVPYELEVWIPVDRPLHDVEVTDPQCDTDPKLQSKKGGDNDNVLEWGEVWVYECSRTVKRGDIPELKNTAEASGLDQQGVKATDKAQALTDISGVKGKRIQPAPPVGGTLPFTGFVLPGLTSMGLGLVGAGASLARIGREKRGRHRARRKRSR